MNSLYLLNKTKVTKNFGTQYPFVFLILVMSAIFCMVSKV